MRFADLFRSTTPITLPNSEVFGIKKEEENLVEEPIVNDKSEWKPLNRSSTYVFKYPPKEDSFTNKFVSYVLRRQQKHLPATKKHFYQQVLGYTIDLSTLPLEEVLKIYGSRVSPNDLELDGFRRHYIDNIICDPITKHTININGHNTQFFGSIINSGIISQNGKFFTIGPNYEKWTQNKLERIKKQKPINATEEE